VKEKTISLSSLLQHVDDASQVKADTGCMSAYQTKMPSY
jgi:hypothetical protein